MLLLLLERHFDSEHSIRATAPRPKPALTFMVQPLCNWLQSRKENDSNDFVGHLKKHDSAVITWLAQVTFLGKDF